MNLPETLEFDITLDHIKAGLEKSLQGKGYFICVECALAIAFGEAVKTPNVSVAYSTGLVYPTLEDAQQDTASSVLATYNFTSPDMAAFSTWTTQFDEYSRVVARMLRSAGNTAWWRGEVEPVWNGEAPDSVSGYERPPTVKVIATKVKDTSLSA